MKGKFALDPDHWRRLAAEARAQADQMLEGERRRLMLKIASGYDDLAEEAKQRLIRSPRQAHHDRGTPQMPIDDGAILQRAKELGAADGYSWEIDRPRTARPRPSLDDAGKREYRARAREQLIAEDPDV